VRSSRSNLRTMVCLTYIDGVFHVIDICFPRLSIQKPLSMSAASDKCIAFVSGLEFGGCKNEMEVQLLMDYLTAEMGMEEVNRANPGN
jgi:hypothetical protein